MKIAFITGGATGIGRATVDKFLSNGIRVGLFDRNEAAAEDALRKHGEDNLLVIAGDVTNREDVRRGVASTVDRFGGLDIVFTCAGIHRNNSILDIEEEEWDAVLDINLKGTFYTLRETAPVLVERGGGAIVLMGSDQCFIGKPSSLAYGASKGAIAQMAKSLALDLGPKNIRVNAVCPGTTRTPLAENAFNRAAKALNRDVDELWAMEADKYPLNRVGAPEEIADVVYFLASDQARWVTGGLYAVDGGLVAG
jgi:NAD(P)-dependent dehydrogenase (short-subunit alcohol dehydrogenase family)